jgi:hypothetical protein
MAGSGRKLREAEMLSHHTCKSCQPPKQVYTSRKAARLAAKRQPGRGRMPAYLCPGGEGWHLGHLPAAVRAGNVGRDIYDRLYREEEAS